MGAFNLNTTSTMQADGGTLTVDATDDFAGGVMASAAQLRCTLNRFASRGTIPAAVGHAIFDAFVDGLEAAVAEAA